MSSTNPTLCPIRLIRISSFAQLRSRISIKFQKKLKNIFRGKDFYGNSFTKLPTSNYNICFRMKEEKALAEKAKRKSEEIRKLKQKAREVEEDEESDPDCWVQTFLAFKFFLVLD
jgi:hypothetical protein